MKAPSYANHLRDLGRAGVYYLPPGAHDALVAASPANGFAAFRVDLGNVKDKVALLQAFASAMDFPDWFGCNWDALADCLNDLAWRPADGYVVLLAHCDGIDDAAGSDFATSLQIVSETIDCWREARKPFWCFVDVPVDNIPSFPTAEEETGN